ncbi:MAG: MopE-related protein, partial [Myxococcota bacterium]|nr:MopE-related protein [Myxococcota bacterium]
CAPLPSPCMASQRCIEAEARCVSSCAVSPDADGDGVDALECGGADCDDADPLRHPGAVEVCDATDHDEDCNPATFGERDADGDTFFDAACCNTDGETSVCGEDCNDRRRDVHPGSSEACDDLDNDCDGAIDEGLLRTSWPDLDRDLHGDEMAAPAMACPGTPGFALVNDDCDDTSPIRHRAQLEICDRIDNDCDGLTDESPVAVPWYRDEDGDLFGAPSDAFVISCEPVDGYSTRSSDCNDADRMINPLSTERCNGVDDDCNGRPDAPGTGPGDTEDDDGDGYADRVCGGDDCDDASASVNRMAQEICNGIDDDCDGIVDGADADARWYLDRDLDGYGDETAPFIEACEPQPSRVTRGGDCDDGDASVHPRAPDFCDDVDADCDGSIDESGVRFAFFPDADGDGWGTTDRASVVFRCTRPAGMSERTGDCADVDPLRHPTAPERCNSIDDDCDSALDESTTEMWYVDVDGDGRGAGAAIMTCLPSTTLSAFGDDCDDGDATRFPTQAERCNGRDDDCDGTADEGASTACGALAHATSSACTAGACVLACDASYDDCDGAVATGCETNTDRNSSYCGSCDTACAPGDSCGLDVAGVCDVSPIVSLSTGESATSITSFALRDNGGAVVWGSSVFLRNSFGSDLWSPLGMSISGIAEIEAGNEVACARTVGRRVLCWGDNDAGQLGSGAMTSGLRGPGPVVDLEDAIALDVGAAHACVVRLGGEVWCWGYRTQGQTGLGTFSASPPGWGQPSPMAVPGITDAVDVFLGGHASCALRGPAGARYVSCWGDNVMIGDGSTTGIGGAATRVAGLPADLVGFANGSGTRPSACVYDSTGAVFCWGLNDYGALGLGFSAANPSRTAGQIPGLSMVVEVALGDLTGCARTRLGEVWCWGQHANSTFTWIDGATGSSAYTPRRAGPASSPLSDATAITVGSARWCAVRSTGAVICMGNDASGGLGNGAPVASSFAMPVTVLDLP